jgi:hypothetical protein
LPANVVKRGTLSLPAEGDLKIFDRILSCLLILGGIGHTLGSFQFFKADPMTLLWSLCASLFIFLLAVVNLLRAGRPADHALAWICLVAGLCWIAVSVRFGMVIRNIFDVRVIIFAVITLALCAMSARTLRS